MMVMYLGYVRPFAEHLTVQVHGSGFSDHVWADERGLWETERLTSVIKQETACRLGEKLTTLDYRHVAISTGRVFVGEQFASGCREEIGEVEEPEMDESDPLELQAGRGEKVGEQRYGVPIDMVKHLSTRSMDTFRRLSEGWHRFLGLGSDERGERRLGHGGVGDKGEQGREEQQQWEVKDGQQLPRGEVPGAAQQQVRKLAHEQVSGEAVPMGHKRGREQEGELPHGEVRAKR
jgi:hypothetical protein